MKKFLLPLVAFIALLGLFGSRLSSGIDAGNADSNPLPSPLIGRAAPAFDAPLLPTVEQQSAPSNTRLKSADLRGRVWVLNVWASWCTSCKAEHAQVRDFAARMQAAGVPVYGLNYKDRPDAARQWLRELGDPYAATLQDPEGRIGIEYGVYGVPETFVIDRAGVVRLRHAGPLTPDVLRTQIEPLLRSLHG